MKIAHVFTVPDSLVFLRGQVEFMKKRGHELVILTSAGPELEKFRDETGAQCHVVQMERRVAPLADIYALGRMTRTLRRVRPALVHAHTPKGGLIGTTAASLLRIPCVYHLRGLAFETLTGVNRDLVRAAERVSCRLAKEVYCVSHSLRERAIEERVAPSHKLRVLGHGSGQGVDATRFFPPNRESRGSARGQSDDRVVFLFVGRLVTDKGLVALQRAWQIVREQMDCVLWIVGKEEERDAVPPRVLASLREDPTVVVSGFAQDPRVFYRGADVVVLPSRREGFPNVPLEAAAMGLPVITTNATGCVDAVVDGTTGFVVPVDDSSALADAMIQYSDRQLRRRHGRAGRERVVRFFRSELVWGHIADVYDSFARRAG